MKQRELLLSQFTPEVTTQLLIFGRQLAEIEADVLVFMARASMCLYDLLLRVGIRPAEQIIITDRVLDQSLEPLQEKRIALVDDTLILGSTLARTKLKLERDTGSEVTTHVFCADERWWSKDVFEPDSISLKLSDEQVMNFCAAEVRAFSLLPRPYIVDFPFSQSVRLKAAQFSELLSSVDWVSRSVSSTLQELNKVYSFSFFPGKNLVDRWRDFLPFPLVDAFDIIKVRGFCRRVDGLIWCKFVPMVTLRPLHRRNLDALFEWLVGCVARISRSNLSVLSSFLLSPSSRLRFSQYSLSLCLGRAFLRSLPISEDARSLLSFTKLEGERLFGPWLDDELASVVNCSEFERLGSASQINNLTLDLKDGVRQVYLDERINANIDDAWSSSSSEEEGSKDGTVNNHGNDIRSLVDEFSAVFLHLHEKHEIPARNEVLQLGREALSVEPGLAPNRDRLRWGIPWQQLVAKLSARYGVTDRREAANLFSLVLDVCNDLGVAVPITCVSENGILYRAYRHGENVQYLAQDDILAWRLLKGLCEASGRKTIPHLVAEKALVMLMRIGPAMDFMMPIFGRSGGEGIVRIDFDLKGAVAVFSRKSSDQRDRNLWLTRHLLRRGVLRISDGGGPYILGKKPSGHASKPDAPLNASQLGYLLGSLLETKVADQKERGPLDDSALILLATCTNPRSAAAALAAELNIFYDWYENYGRIALEGIKWSEHDSLPKVLTILRSSRGYEALNSASLKYRGFVKNKPRQIVETCYNYLRRHPLGGPLGAETWKTYWSAVVSGNPIKEKAIFLPWMDKSILLIWELHSLVAIVEIALESAIRGFQTAEKDSRHSRSVTKLLSFDDSLRKSGLDQPPLVHQINRRFLEKDKEIFSDQRQSALHFSVQKLDERLPRVRILAEDIQTVYNNFVTNTGRHDYRYLLWYDIIDSTATLTAREGEDVSVYRGKIRKFKRQFNNQLHSLAIVAKKQKAVIYSFLGDISSGNDEKHIFFSGEFALEHMISVLDALLDCSRAFDTYLRICLVRTDFAGSSAYRWQSDAEVSGERFWEHLSRLLKALKNIQGEVVPTHRASFLAVAGDLIQEIESRIQIHWNSRDTREVETEIAGLYRKTSVRVGRVADTV